MILFSVECNAQQLQTAQNDSTVNAIKINNLKNQKTALQKRIAVEDKKRNAVIEGVSPETLEKRNERQDSICLELRSELTSIELELKELGADGTTAQIAQQYNNLIHNNQQDSTQVSVQNVNTFFAVCCEIVLHPRILVPLFLCSFSIFLISSKSNPM